jgi:hypothetical protein
MFQILRALASHDYEEAAQLVADGDAPPDAEEEATKERATWTPASLEAAMKRFYEEHSAVRTDPAARSPQNTIIHDETAGAAPGTWEVSQVIADPEEDNDWFLDCVVDLRRSRAAARPIVTLRRITT